MKEETIFTIERMAFGGEGVGRVDGKVVFVPLAAKGDRVRVRTLADHGRYERAEIVEIVEPSPDRVIPRCPVFGQCGGCQWQHLSYEAQLKTKESILKDTLARIGQLSDPVILPIISASDPWNYRRRVQLKVDAQGQIGFHGFHSHQVVPFEKCEIADDRLNQKIGELRLKMNGERPKESFELSVKDESGVAVMVGDGSDRVFLQIHAAQNQRLIETVLHFAFGGAEMAFTRKRTIVELYAGSGNFTFPLAEKAGKIIAVEENETAVKQGMKESISRGLDHVEWIQGTSEWGLKKIYRRKTPVDLLVLDPPRRGAKDILDLVPLVRPRFIIYVSCDPVTLARDLQFLVRRHYRLEKIQPIDMFPQTYHIESVAYLSLSER